jgi:(p)ppGpp synthase/HD superfamily hydrolase
MRLPDWKSRIVGVLHDVIEDTRVTAENLHAFSLPEDCIAAVVALSRKKGELYADFIDRIIAAGPLAMRVKLADLAENTRPDRRHPTQEELSKRYTKAVAKISAALGEAA